MNLSTKLEVADGLQCASMHRCCAAAAPLHTKNQGSPSPRTACLRLCARLNMADGASLRDHARCSAAGSLEVCVATLEHASDLPPTEVHPTNTAALTDPSPTQLPSGCSHCQAPPARSCAWQSFKATSAIAFPNLTFSAR